MTTDPKLSTSFDPTGPIASALERHERMALGILLLFAALFRVLRWSAVAVLFNDGPVFLALAEKIAEGEWAAALGHEFHPLYPALIAAAHAIVPDWELAAVAVSVLSGTIAVACLYGFVRAAFGRATAFAAAAILSVHPYAIEYSGDVQSEGLYLALFLGAVWALWLAIRSAAPRAAATAGLLCGLAYLTRPEGIGLLAVGIALAVAQTLRGSWSPRRGAKLAALIVLGASLSVVPYIAWLRVENGGWSITQKKSVGWVAGYGEPPPRYMRETKRASDSTKHETRGEASSLRSTQQGEPRPPKHVEQNRSTSYGDALAELLRTQLRALRPELFALLVAGWLVGRWRRPTLRGGFVLLVIGLYGVVLLGLAANVGYVSARHTLPPISVALGHVGAALLVLVGTLRRPRRWLGLTLVLAVIAGIGLGKALRPDRTDSLAERTVAEWFRAQDLPPGGVAVHKRRIAYYAGAPAVRISRKAGTRMIRKIRKRGADYLILNDEDIGNYRGLAEFLGSQARLLHRAEVGGSSAAVYLIRPEDEVVEDSLAPTP